MKSSALKQRKIKTVMTTNVMVRASLFTAISVLLKLVFEIYIPLAGLPALRINLTSVPIILSGIICGPIAGLLTGALSDILCFMIKPSGPYFPGFTLTSALTGLIPALIYKFLKKDNNFRLFNALFILMIAGGCVEVLISKGVLTIQNRDFLYNGEPLNIIFSLIFIALTVAYIYVPSMLARREDKSVDMDKIIFTVSVTQVLTSIILNTYFLSMLFGKGFLIFLPGRILTNYILVPLYSIITAVILKYFKTNNFNYNK